MTIDDEYKYKRQRVCEHRHIFLLPITRNSADADIPRDAFVQTAWLTTYYYPLPMCVTTPNLVVLRQKM